MARNCPYSGIIYKVEFLIVNSEGLYIVRDCQSKVKLLNSLEHYEEEITKMHYLTVVCWRDWMQAPTNKCQEIRSIVHSYFGDASYFYLTLIDEEHSHNNITSYSGGHSLILLWGTNKKGISIMRRKSMRK